MKISLGYQVLIAVLAGIAVGLFFGPYCAVLTPVWEIFAMLLQMVALPYISFSVMHGLGSTSPAMAWKLLKKGWFFLLLLWAIVLIVINVLNSLLPKPLSASMTEVGAKSSLFSSDFLNYIIPQNPFYDFANNIVPAVAIFGLIMGCAIMHLPKKEPLLGFLERCNDSIEELLVWLAYIAPIGIFAHISVTFGTVDIADLYKLEFYVIAVILVTLFLTVWILPTLLSTLTPLHFREVLKEFKSVCLLAFATGIPTIAFPFITKCVRKVAHHYKIDSRSFTSTSQTVIPLGYSFAQLGNYFILFFIMFISYYYRHPFTPTEKGLLNFLTIPMSFGTNTISISATSFLITHLDLPQEAFSLFVQTLAILANFQVLLSVAGTFTFVLLVLFAYHNMLKVNWKKLFLEFLFAIGFFTTTILLVKHFVRLDDNYQHLWTKMKMADVVSSPVKPKIYKVGETIPAATDVELEPFVRVLKSHRLRVGYSPTNVPFCYLNDQKELVGYDVAFAYQLARELDCELEFIPLDIYQLPDQLNNNVFDVVMSAVVMDEERIKSLDFTKPYIEQHNVLVVPLKNRSQYLNLNLVDQKKGLRIGTVGAYQDVVTRHFPLAKDVVMECFIPVEIEEGIMDAVIWSELPAFVWCLENPNYVAMHYGNALGKKYFAYPTKKGAYEWVSFLNNWLNLKAEDGFTERQEKYWLKGEAPAPTVPRWSILRNVLHWVH